MISRKALIQTVFVCGFLMWSCAVCRGADAPSKAVFAYGAINAYMTSIWVAREQGFFAKHNVELEPVFIIAARAAQAMLAGEVHVGLIGPTHVANAVAAGGDLVMVMGNQNSVRYQLVVHPSIKRAEDLKGKRVAIGASAGGLASLGAHVALEHLGLNPKRDSITLLLTGEEPVRVAALQSGSAQATLLAPEMTKQIGGQDFAVLVDMGQLNIPFQASGLVTTRKILRNDPVLIERVGRIVGEKNARLPSYARVKRFALLPAGLSEEAGELTPTQKLRRKLVAEKYADLLESLYRPGPA